MSRMLALVAAALLALAPAAEAQTHGQPVPASPPAALPADGAVAPVIPDAPPQPVAPQEIPAAASTAPAAVPAAAPAAAAPTTAPPPPPPAQPVPVAQPAPPPPAQSAKPATAAAAPAPQGPSGKLYTWGALGTTFTAGETYANLTVGAGYYLIRTGLAPNLELSYSFGQTPTIWALRPGVSWYMQIPVLHPYLGAYYARWLVGNGQPDQNAVGARAGISLGRFISLGATYERVLDCSRNCDAWAPMITAGASM
jgi:hypothetical protein